MRADSTEPLIRIFVARDIPHAYLVKASLEAEGVFVVIEGESLGFAIGEVPPQDGAPQILVRKPEVARAIAILRQNGERV